jgi:hypothetical protein
MVGRRSSQGRRAGCYSTAVAGRNRYGPPCHVRLVGEPGQIPGSEMRTSTDLEISPRHAADTERKRSGSAHQPVRRRRMLGLDAQLRLRHDRGRTGPAGTGSGSSLARIRTFGLGCRFLWALRRWSEARSAGRARPLATGAPLCGRALEEPRAPALYSAILQAFRERRAG